MENNTLFGYPVVVSDKAPPTKDGKPPTAIFGPLPLMTPEEEALFRAKYQEYIEEGMRQAAAEADIGLILNHALVQQEAENYTRQVFRNLWPEENKPDGA